MVSDLKAAKPGEYTHEEINKIKLHPVHAADYVRKMTEIPSDVDQIIFQHHEKADGSGFPRNLSGKFITPLSAVFIAAHEIVEFMRTRENESLEVFLKENEALYHQGTFRKIWLVLKTDGKV
jgi:HD-GYP domain-containing protein (c-di-GMP phosphodiesterase class II)